MATPASPADGPENARKLLLAIYRDALEAVNGRRVVREALATEVPSDSRAPWQIIAIGKAAAAMAQGAFEALGDKVIDALIVSRDGHFAPVENEPRARIIPSSHPVPDERSLDAGQLLVESLERCPRNRHLLLLVSGGASSLVEVLKPGVSLELLQRWNQWAHASSLDIEAINAVRTRLSAIKGGQLLSHIHNETIALFISDVPGDDPAVIGSGLFGEPAVRPLPAGLPDWILAWTKRDSAQQVSDPPTAAKPRIRRRVVAALEQAMSAAQRSAEALGLRVKRHDRRISGPAAVLATRLCHEMALGTEQLHVWGGESTVQLPAVPGRGGRNQHLALAAARLLESHAGMALLAVATDGTDGSTPDAGGIVDGGTIERGTLDGLDVDESLARADSGTFLEAAGDLVHTGPTGTNVGDLVLGYKAR
jgi:hydroxypyruvate reductase